jgi:hypothetical protein
MGTPAKRDTLSAPFGPRQPSCHANKGPKKPEENPKIPLDTASYKRYYVKYEVRLDLPALPSANPLNPAYFFPLLLFSCAIS